MFSTRIYLKIVFQVTIIVIVAGLGLAGIVSGKAIILGCVTLLIALWLVGVLVYFLNTSNRRIQLFLDAIEDNESMLYFPENSGPEEQRRLHTAFNRIHHLMTESKQKEFERELLRKEYEAYDKLMHVLTHEIMNSIAPIVSLSGTLLSYYRSNDTTKSCDEINDATIRKTVRGLDTIKSQCPDGRSCRVKEARPHRSGQSGRGAGKVFFPAPLFFRRTDPWRTRTVRRGGHP